MAANLQLNIYVQALATFGYDVDGLLTAIDYPAGTADVSYEYDAAGNVVSMSDGRDFSSNSDPGASRGYIWIPLADPQNYVAHMNPSGYLLFNPTMTVSSPPIGPVVGNYAIPLEWKYFPPSDQNDWNVTAGADGMIYIQYDLVVSGPLEGGAAPHINGSLSCQQDCSGKIDYSFERDGFPWAEAYYHDGRGSVSTIFQDPAMRGNPHDLFAIEPNIGLAQQWVRDLESILYGFPQPSTRP